MPGVLHLERSGFFAVNDKHAWSRPSATGAGDTSSAADRHHRVGCPDDARPSLPSRKDQNAGGSQSYLRLLAHRALDVAETAQIVCRKGLLEHLILLPVGANTKSQYSFSAQSCYERPRSHRACEEAKEKEQASQTRLQSVLVLNKNAPLLDGIRER